MILHIIYIDVYCSISHNIQKIFIVSEYLLNFLSQWLSINTKDIVDRYLLPVRDMQYTYLVC